MTDEQVDLMNPISKEDLDGLRERLKEIDYNYKAIDKAIRAGIDVGSARADLKASEDRIKRLLQVYGNV